MTLDLDGRPFPKTDDELRRRRRAGSPVCKSCGETMRPNGVVPALWRCPNPYCAEFDTFKSLRNA